MADIKIYGKLVNDTPEAIVADAAQIKADTGKTQHEFNNDVVDAISDEQSEREAADTELDGKITNEVTARSNAVQGLIDDLSTEQTARTTADQALQTAITQLEAKQVMAITLNPTTGVLSLHYDNNSNVTNAILGEDGKLKIIYEI